MADPTPLFIEPDVSVLCDFFMAKVALHGCFLRKTNKLFCRSTDLYKLNDIRKDELMLSAKTFEKFMKYLFPDVLLTCQSHIVEGNRAFGNIMIISGKILGTSASTWSSSENITDCWNLSFRL